MRTLLLLITLGCRIPPVDSEPLVDVQLTTPEITELTLNCDTERERWQLDIKATSWTGGCEWWWTTDGFGGLPNLFFGC